VVRAPAISTFELWRDRSAMSHRSSGRPNYWRNPQNMLSNP